VVTQGDAAPCRGYELSRLSTFCGQTMRHGDWYPDRVLRLFRRDGARFSDDLVHERLLLDGPVGRLEGHLLHDSVPSLDHALDKIAGRTQPGADQRRRLASARRRRPGGRLGHAPGRRPLDVRFKLWDVVKGQDLGGQRLRGAGGRPAPGGAPIADYIYEKLTGERACSPPASPTSPRPAAATRCGWPMPTAKRAGGAGQPRAHHLAGLVARRRAAGLCVVRIAQAGDLRARRVHGERRLLANFRGSNSAPAWSPDGRKLAVTLSRDGGSQLYT
jgi:hypothetical protein